MPSKISRLTDYKFLWVVKCQIEGINHRKTLGAQVVGSKVASSAVSTCKVPGPVTQAITTNQLSAPMQVGIPDSRRIQEKRSKDQESRKDFTEEAAVNTLRRSVRGRGQAGAEWSLWCWPNPQSAVTEAAWHYTAPPAPLPVWSTKGEAQKALCLSQCPGQRFGQEAELGRVRESDGSYLKGPYGNSPLYLTPPPNWSWTFNFWITVSKSTGQKTKAMNIKLQEIPQDSISGWDFRRSQNVCLNPLLPLISCDLWQVT